VKLSNILCATEVGCGRVCSMLLPCKYVLYFLSFLSFFLPFDFCFSSSNIGIIIVVVFVTLRPVYRRQIYQMMLFEVVVNNVAK
jgi:hypothetical protein